MGRAGASARGVPRLRRRPLRRRPGVPVPCGPVRPAPAGRRPRSARSAPAMPYRHRHRLPQPARGGDVGPGLLRAGGGGRSYPRSASRGRHRLPAGRCVRRGGGLRRGAFRPRLHRDRCAVLAAGHRPLGSGGRATAAPGRPALPPRGSSGALVAGRSPTGRVAGHPHALLRATRADGLGRRRHLRQHRAPVRQHRLPRLESRPGRSGDLGPGCRPDRDRTDRARHGSVERPPRRDGRGRRESGGCGTGRSDSPARTRCRPASRKPADLALRPGRGRARGTARRSL